MGNKEESGSDNQAANRNTSKAASRIGRRESRGGFGTDRHDQHDGGYGKRGT